MATAVALALAALLSIAVDAGSARALTLRPHEALYTMTLAGATARSDVIAAEGTMMYRFGATCDGWTVENRTVLRLTYEGGNDTRTRWSFASWEAGDGQRYRFHARYEQDGKTVEMLSGSARLDGAGGAGEARFSEPDDRVVPLPAGSLFPTEHIRQLIEAGAAGENHLGRVVFDGASLDNPYYVNALFGTLSEADRDALNRAVGLEPRPAWWIRMAFFPYAAESERPEFEIGAHYRDDGIADRIVQQFDTFALDVRLKSLEVLPPPDC